LTGANQFSRYPEFAFTTLRHSIARRLNADVDCICVGAGIDGLLVDLVSTFSAPGDEIIVQRHTFPNIAYCAQVRGVEIVTVPMRPDFRIDFTLTRAEVRRGTRMIYLCNPNNPTGLRENINDVGDLAKSVACLVVVDEANIEYSGQSCVSILDKHPNMIILRTFSKAHGLAGLRIGYCVAAPELIHCITRCRPPFPISSVAADLADKAVDDSDHVHRSSEHMREEIAFLTEEIRSRGFEVVPSQANCFICRAARPDGLADSLQSRLESVGASVIDGRHFELSPDYVRIAPQTRDINERFLAALDRAFQ
jgi:histidinol-phosphate aminotransferase